MKKPTDDEASPNGRRGEAPRSASGSWWWFVFLVVVFVASVLGFVWLIGEFGPGEL